MFDTERMDALAAAVADGSPLDWEAEARYVVDAGLRETLANLRAIADVGHVLSSISAQDPHALARPPRLEPGATWGSLRIVEHIGAGRFGDVYRAFDPALDREVALKLTRSPREEAPAADVVHEGRLMARVHHPNVITIFGAQRIGEVAGIWMELVRGRTLAAERQARGVFEAEDLQHVGVALCGALEAVHEAGLVHRDVKAQNVLRDARGRVVLGDFGTGRDLEPLADATASLAGTPAYVAPELFTGAMPDRRTDVYSLGVLLFHLATGTFPVSGGSLAAIRDAHALGQRVDLSTLRPDLPAPLRDVIERALSVNPAHRFPSASAMRAALAPDAAPRPEPIPRRGWLLVAGLLIATAASVASLTDLRGDGTVPFAARDWILVTSVENRTGDPTLDRALNFALTRELSTSSFVNLVPPERVQDTLRLMRRDPGAPVTVEVGREIAVRDGRVRLVLAGSLERLGGEYLLGTQLIDPADGRVAWSATERARSVDQLLDAVRRASDRLRTGVGESPTAVRPTRQLAPATTSSLRALQLYSQAVALLDAEVGPRGGLDEGATPVAGRNPAAAAALLAEALALDPDFALAHLARAAALLDTTPFDPDRSEGLRHLDRAEATAVHSAETERLFVRGRVALLRASSAEAVPRDGLLAAAAASFEALRELQPDQLGVLINLANIYRRQGRAPESTALLDQIAELRPGNPGAQLMAAHARIERGDVDGARLLVDRVQLMNAPAAALRPFQAAWLALFPAHQAWLRNDPAEALRLADAVAARADLHEQSLFHVFSLYLTLGRLDQAEQLLDAHPDMPDRDVRRSMVLAERGDPAALGRFLRARFSDIAARGSRVGSLWLDAKLLAQARQSAAHNPLPLYLGQVALAERRYDDAIGLLRQVLRSDAAFGSPGGGRAARKLADALESVGRGDEAIAELERVLRLRAIVGPSSGYEWLKTRDALAQLYLRLGRTTDAELLDAELEQLLAVADDDHPIRRRLAARRRP
jgi:serine/threonine protein kinase/tetratricopeptide (TPR) repeat protein